MSIGALSVSNHRESARTRGCDSCRAGLASATAMPAQLQYSQRPRHPVRAALRSLAAIVLLALGANSALAEEMDATSHSHATLSVDETLTLAGTVEQALANYPDFVELEARSTEARAWEERGRDWFPERPSLSLRYQTDRWGDNDRLDEYEAGVSLPLWSWNGRRATQSFAQAMKLESDAASQRLRWEVAGLLRNMLWNIALAEHDVEQAQTEQEMAQKLAVSVERRHELGDVALGDVLLAQSAALEAQTSLVDAHARRVDAERDYSIFTGLNRRPPHRGETLSTHDRLPDDHPALAFAAAEIRRAESAHKLAAKVSTTAPSLLIGPRRERAANAEQYDDSIGMTLTIPFGHSSQKQIDMATARRELAAARAAHRREIRIQTLRRHEAQHTLDTVHHNIDAAAARAELATRHRKMGVLAYQKGELELLDLLRLQRNANAAERQLARLQIEQNRQIAFYNQAVGVLP